ncbi:MAG: TonB family protein [Caenispirillum sp.]|nr:TonB family protein [Caenispirillum sp.]
MLALHAAALWGLWQHRLAPAPREALTLFVNFIAPPAPARKEEAKPPQAPKPKTPEKPQPRQIVAAAPVVAPTDHIAPPPPAPAIEAPAPPASPPAPSAPLALSTELAVVCPERTAPVYPSVSRRLGEEGTVVLRVELDDSGRVAAARVHSGSGHARLDEAALGVVYGWRCTPAERNGRPVRAVALQPFKFVLQGY